MASQFSRLPRTLPGYFGNVNFNPDQWYAVVRTTHTDTGPRLRVAPLTFALLNNQRALSNEVFHFDAILSVSPDFDDALDFATQLGATQQMKVSVAVERHDNGVQNEAD